MYLPDTGRHAIGLKHLRPFFARPRPFPHKKTSDQTTKRPTNFTNRPCGMRETIGYPNMLHTFKTFYIFGFYKHYVLEKLEML